MSTRHCKISLALESRVVDIGSELHTLKCVAQQSQTAEPSSHISNVGIWLKDGYSSHHEHHSCQRLLSESKAERHTVAQHMQPENTQEEGSEGVEHLDEEIPPEARSEMDLSLSKMERIVMDYIAASNDKRHIWKYILRMYAKCQDIIKHSNMTYSIMT